MERLPFEKNTLVVLCCFKEIPKIHAKDDLNIDKLYSRYTIPLLFYSDTNCDVWNFPTDTLIDASQKKIIEIFYEQKEHPINLDMNDYYLGIIEDEKYTLSTFIQCENKIYNKYKLKYYLLHGDYLEPYDRFIFKFNITDLCTNNYVNEPITWKKLKY
jgi:hypothetical protein